MGSGGGRGRRLRVGTWAPVVAGGVGSGGGRGRRLRRRQGTWAPGGDVGSGGGRGRRLRLGNGPRWPRFFGFQGAAGGVVERVKALFFVDFVGFWGVFLGRRNLF